ncbi:MAG: hypothetical protein ACLSIH_02230 [Eggerthella lenta]
MPEFLKKASCRGRRPLHLVPRRQIPRPNLIAKLLRERHVARFIVAPDGFGKTGLAMEYADTVFSFEHVVWLDGRSPCFLRDLDRGVIARTLLEGDPQPFLVVIDDVPLLDPERAELLSDELDLLLDRDCEVMVACMPSRDAFARHRDRIKLTAVDLLLTDEEVDLLRTPGERSSDPASTIAPACRVATFVWGSDEERAGFLSAVLGEELPADLLLPLFVMASLGKGTFEDVAAFGPFGPDQDALLAEQYPYLGIDSRSGRFEAAPFEVEALAGAFARKLGALADRSLFSDASTLVVRLGDALAMRGEHERACDFVRLLASRAPRASWLAKHGAALLEAACLVPACEVHRSLSGETAGKGALLSAHEAVRRALLGDRQAACVAARKAVRDRNAPSSVQMTGALVLAQCAEADERGAPTGSSCRGSRPRASRLRPKRPVRPSARRRRKIGDGSLRDACMRSCGKRAAPRLLGYGSIGTTTARAGASSSSRPPKCCVKLRRREPARPDRSSSTVWAPSCARRCPRRAAARSGSATLWPASPTSGPASAGRSPFPRSTRRRPSPSGA